MKLKSGHHLTYCTNIHAGETWEQTFQKLQDYLPDIKARISPSAPFGIGLRLSNQASLDLLEANALDNFKTWLSKEGFYVFTLNGFPYGAFHFNTVKDQVHAPDWTTSERLLYTKRLITILAELLPDGVEGGISTSPLSYKPWIISDLQCSEMLELATNHLSQLAFLLHSIREKTGKLIHIDLEPEPDGVLENTADTVEYFTNYLYVKGCMYLQQQYSVLPPAALDLLKRHITVCYDVCHFALAFEEPEDVFLAFKNAGIGIGKIQVSSAMKIMMMGDETDAEIRQLLTTYAEPVYLHQVAIFDKTHKVHYPDLHVALSQHPVNNYPEEWRIHYHVPIFQNDYNTVSSTQSEIRKVLNILKNEQVTQHLEVETYTWEVLPGADKIPLKDSILREMTWMLGDLLN